MVVDPNSSVYTMNSKTQHNMWHGLCENLQREFDISSNVRFIIVPIILLTYSVTKGEVLFSDMNRKFINFRKGPQTFVTYGPSNWPDDFIIIVLVYTIYTSCHTLGLIIYAL